MTTKMYPVNLKSENGTIYKAPIMRKDANLIKAVSLLEAVINLDEKSHSEAASYGYPHHDEATCLDCQIWYFLRSLKGDE